VPELKDAPRPLAPADVVPPAFELPAHASPLGLTFYRGTQFPAAYRYSSYLAIHGSSARSSKIGYSVVRVVMKDGRPVSSEDFVTGWLNDGVVAGRPAGASPAPTARFTSRTTTKASSTVWRRHRRVARGSASAGPGVWSK